jgi:hypothetical protein
MSKPGKLVDLIVQSRPVGAVVHAAELKPGKIVFGQDLRGWS